MGNGAEWIKCACGQWIHEECVESTANGVNGKVRCCFNNIIFHSALCIKLTFSDAIINMQEIF